MRILVVDDDPNILEILRVILTTEGARHVACAASAKEAILSIRSESKPFDCLIFDISMPGTDGIQLCRQVRAMDEYRPVPIIMLTALREEESMREALQAGASDYITKPFDVLQVGVRIRMAARLVKANRLLTSMREEEQREAKTALRLKSNLTRKEIMTLFAADLYKSSKG
ncbi:response regulator [Roseibium sp.]|uniref:response regulator n=1 Tax=Roseibium sp. TaxID=1936156 RepID=UPI003A96DC8D